MTMKTKKTLQHIAAVAVVLLTLCLVFAAPVSAEGTECSGCDTDTDTGHTHVASATKDGTTKYYTDLQKAIEENPSGTVNILRDVTVNTWRTFSYDEHHGPNYNYNVDGKSIYVDIDGLTINGQNHALTINTVTTAFGSVLLFDSAKNLTIRDLTITSPGNCAGIALTSGSIVNVTFNKGIYGVHPWYEDEVIIDKCTFNEITEHAIFTESSHNFNKLVVTGNSFNLAASDDYAIMLCGGVTFTGNTFTNGRVNVVSGSPTVSGNNFGENRFKVYNGATATISGNTINNLVFNDGTDVKSKFKGNTLNEASKTALNAVYTPTITFETDGGSEIQAISDKSGTTITAPANPTRDGYVFGGWNPAIPATMPDEDMTVKAIWEAIVYDISAAPTEVGFDSVKVGYTQPDAQEVIITNKGNVPVTLTATATSGKYDVTVTPATIGLEGTAKVTIKPNAGLPVGNYADTLTITVEGTDKSLSIPVSFLVYQPISGGSSNTKPEEPVEPETPVEPENPTEEPEAGEPSVETEVTDGGEVLFEEPVAPETPGADTPSDEPAEPAITGVVLPTGTDSEVTFVPVSEQAAPAGKETQTKKVFEINVPSYEKGKAAVIKFTMTVAELAADGKTAADVALWHFDEETGEWTKLVTSYVIVDGVVYFEAITNDFSPFAIIYEDEPVDEPVDEPETPESPAPVLGLLAALGAAVALRRK